MAAKKLKVNNFVRMPDGTVKRWEEFTPEEQYEIGIKLNRQAMEAIGGIAVERKE